ncbi:unnamed protein product, partial [Pleuronectes platessa]
MVSTSRPFPEGSDADYAAASMARVSELLSPDLVEKPKLKLSMMSQRQQFVGSACAVGEGMRERVRPVMRSWRTMAPRLVLDRDTEARGVAKDSVQRSSTKAYTLIAVPRLPLACSDEQ